MSVYGEERENKNFISGLNFCVDLPIQCDCGIEKTLPQKSKVEGAKVRVIISGIYFVIKTVNYIF